MALSKDKQEYFERVFGKDHAARILEDWDKRGKMLEEFEVEYKDFVAAPEDTAAANKEAVEHADKAFGELVADLVADNGAVIEATTEAVKEVKALREQVAEGLKQIDELRKEMDLRPRAASKASETEVEVSHLSPALQESLKQQNTRIDPIWGTEVTVTP